AFPVFMEVLDTTIANVALPYIGGGLGVSQDEASWVVTTYLVANAVSLTASSYFARRFGRKSYFLTCLLLFTISSVLCGFAPSLPALLAARVLQGLGGGGMVPVSQSIIADAFPPEKRGQGFAMFGIAVIVAPVVGPTLGGWIADNISWQWCFLINGPVGVVAILLISVMVHDSPAVVANRRRFIDERHGFDLIGFALVATFLGTLEITLDRGLEDDWFASRFIIVVASLCLASFVLMIPWELRRRNPMIDLRMVATRQFGACFIFMLATGAILISTIQYLPQLVQQSFGYTATMAGLVLTPGGLVTALIIPGIGKMTAKVQPRYMMAAGAAITAFAMYDVTRLNSDSSFWFFSLSRIYLGFGLPLIFISITSASYDGIRADQTDMASALINAARNIGGSIGISLSNNILAHRMQFHQNRMVEIVSASHPQYQIAMKQATAYFISHGSPPLQAQRQALALIGQQLQLQAGFLAYIDVFWVLMLISAAAVPLALTLRKIRLGGTGMMH
ncbi:MAG: DHA2 family efflux MFS transporter permease subunit, partial [Alphaproteobacteria bacterium]|nr:DHA2 family efflux MFS transporter permease subunit [Alphaproteobacteria bacterium]